MAAYSVLSSDSISQDDLAAFLAPWNPEPSYQPDGSLHEGWLAVLIEEPILLHVFLEEPDELPRSMRDAASQLLGAPIASVVAMFSFERPGTPLSLMTSVEDLERSEREGLRKNDLERDLVWHITWNLGRSWPAVLSDHTGVRDTESWYLSVLGRDDSLPPWSPHMRKRPTAAQKRSWWQQLFDR